MSAIPMPPARRDPTADTAIERASRTERPTRGPLTYTLADALTAKRAAGALSGFEAMLLRLAA